MTAGQEAEAAATAETEKREETREADPNLQADQDQEVTANQGTRAKIKSQAKAKIQRKSIAVNAVIVKAKKKQNTVTVSMKNETNQAMKKTRRTTIWKVMVN